jgi:hypothetical protein
MSLYSRVIKEEAAKMGVVVDPRHVEAWMRLEWGVLDSRPRSDFRRYVRLSVEAEKTHPGEGESLARSYGL